jgi:hypothetical protein
MGPFQDGSIYSGPMFAGERLKATPFAENQQTQQAKEEAEYRSAFVFDPQLQRNLEAGEVGSSTARLSRLPEEGEPAGRSADDAGAETR